MSDSLCIWLRRGGCEPSEWLATREAVERRRDDPEFKQRVYRIIEEDTKLLERLAK
ncbi:MAG: hypothetical protein MUP97_15240 [Acidimicrobiia bacterium]|nr:hypothetical protein [Acidimicrobiia bacterium]